MVRARFTLADGSQFQGLVTPDQEKVSRAQPFIVATGGHVGFWHGALPLKTSEIRRSYALLGKSEPADVFPVKCVCDLPTLFGAAEWTIEGFASLGERLSDPHVIQR